jgi:hypothetical protein
MSRQNSNRRKAAVAKIVTDQHKKGLKVSRVGSKHGKVRRLDGSTNHIGFKPSPKKSYGSSQSQQE